eukprot:SAG31_NODE_1981_length_6745_cov_84.170178_6_plen_113_part_00
MEQNVLLGPQDLLHSFPQTDPLNRWFVLAQRDVRVPMRDGVELAADIYRPAHGNGEPVMEVPALLIRTSCAKTTIDLCLCSLLCITPVLFQECARICSSDNTCQMTLVMFLR